MKLGVAILWVGGAAGAYFGYRYYQGYQTKHEPMRVGIGWAVPLPPDGSTWAYAASDNCTIDPDTGLPVDGKWDRGPSPSVQIGLDAEAKEAPFLQAISYMATALSLFPIIGPAIGKAWNLGGAKLLGLDVKSAISAAEKRGAA